MEIAALREVIETRFDGVDSRFDNVDRRLDDLTVQVRETNGRLRQAEAVIPVHAARLEAAERDLKRLHDGRRGHATGAEQGDRRRITMRDVTVFLAGGAALIAAWRFVEFVVQVLKGGA